MIQSDSDIKSTFGKTVRRIRYQLGISQEALADRCSLDRTYIGGIERGERNIGLVNIIRISEALDIPTAILFESFSDD